MAKKIIAFITDTNDQFVDMISSLAEFAIMLNINQQLNHVTCVE